MTKEKKTLANVASEYPEFTFCVFYDVWECPGSTKRRQACLSNIPATELAKKYGSFELNGWYTTGADTADIWASATEPCFVYDSLDRVCYTGTEYVATLSTREQDLIRNAVESSLRVTGAFTNDTDMLAAVENAMNGRLCDLEDCVNWRNALTGGNWRTDVPYPDFNNDYENF